MAAVCIWSLFPVPCSLSAPGDQLTPIRPFSNYSTLSDISETDGALRFRGAAVSGTSSWGGITGTLSAQTDLNSALSAKQDAATAATDSELSAHTGSTSNPHSVTAAQAGADPTGTASSAVSTHAGLTDPHTGYMLESNIGTGANNYPQLNASGQLPAVSGALLTNLPAATALSAQYIDWSASTGPTSIANKPTLGTIATLNTGTLTDGQYCTYSTASGIVCNASGGSHDAVTLSTDLGNNLLGVSTQQLTLDSQTANRFFAAPNGSDGVPSFRAMVAADVPTLNQNTTGTAAGLTAQYIDWSASSGGASIANKPTLGTASAQDAGYFALAGHNHSGTYEPADATILKQADVDDTPVNGITTAPVSSNWAYDHAAAADPHTGYMLESNLGTGANNYPQLDASGHLLPTILPITGTWDASAVSITLGGITFGNGATSGGFYRMYEDTDNGTNYIQDQAPAAITSNRTHYRGDYDSQEVAEGDVDASGHVTALATSSTPQVAGIEVGNVSDTTITRAEAGRIAVEGVNVPTISTTDTLTNKTLDANGAGNVLKGYGYITFTKVHNRGSATGAVGTTETTQLYGVPSFADDVETNNYVDYIGEVPRDWDSSVDPVAYFKFRLGGADTGDHDYIVSMIDIADSGAAAGTPGDAINLGYTADGSGADGDIETATATLTGWGAAATAGSYWLIRVTRDGDDGTNDASTVDSYPMALTIRYGFTQ
jgi:hypothetical protein